MLEKPASQTWRPDSGPGGSTTTVTGTVVQLRVGSGLRDDRGLKARDTRPWAPGQCSCLGVFS